VINLLEKSLLRTYACIALSTLVISAVVPNAGAAQRQVDNSSCSPNVSLAITPPAAVTTWAFEEFIGRLTPTNISGNGVWIETEGVIRWGADLDPLTATLSYDLSGSDGSYRISGDESLDGKSTAIGEDQVILSCESESAPGTAAMPSLSQPSGTRVPVEVSITTGTAGATIYYTLDGSKPTASSAVYSGALNLTEATYLRAIVVKDGMLTSEVVSAYYAGPQRILTDLLSQTFIGGVCEPVVTIDVTPVSTIETYGVETLMPRGMFPTEISDGGVWDADTQKVKWGAFEDSQARSLTFKLEGPDGIYTIQSIASFDGFDELVGGETQVEQDCIPPMAEAPKFDPPKGRVPVTVGMSSDTEGAIIRFTLDGTEPTSTSAQYESPITIDEPLTLKARAFKDGLEPSEITKSEYLTGTRPKAIVVAGGGPYEGNVLWPATLKVSQYAYNALMYQGYSKDDIWLISPVSDVDFDGNGELDDVDADATSANLEYAITEWAKNASDLIVYLTDHGGDGEFVLNNLGTQPDLVSVGSLDAWFDALQSESEARITFIYDACQSGTFVEGLLPPEGRDRIVLTSASNEAALFLERGVLSFSYQFWAAVFYKGQFYDAYLAARNLVKEDQRPLLDANGNGIANEKADFALIQNITIGRGAVAASVPPELNDVSPTQTLNGETSATITVGSITALNPITRVWAVVVPPNSRSRSADEPVTELPTFELSDPEGDGSYSATYSDFTKNGTYKIQLYARDNQGVIAIPVYTEVIQAQGEIVPNDAPEAIGASYSIEEDETLEGTLQASDANGDLLTFAVVSDGERGTVTLVDLQTGEFRYRPHANESGTDQFTFLVNDGNEDSAETVISITISAKEDVPEARDARFTIDPGESIEGTLPGLDGDGDPLTYAILDAPSAGTLTLIDSSTGAFTFDSAGAIGKVSFTYSVSDGKATSDPGLIEIEINRGFNTAPVANQCLITVEEDGVAEYNLGATDADGDPVTFKLIGQAANGLVEVAENGVVSYTPKQDFFGSDTFSFGVSDGIESGEAGKCEITVNAVNDAPNADGLSISVTETSGVSATLVGSDIDSVDLLFEIVDQPLLGSVSLTNGSTGAFVYSPNSTENGSDSFTYRVSDGDKQSEVGTVQVALRLPQAEMNRTVNDGVCLADVTIDVAPVSTVKAYAVVETLPPGVVPETISGNGIWEADTNSIRWGTFKDAQVRRLTYSFTADDGAQSIAGLGSFDGWDQMIPGEADVEINCDGARVEAPVISPESGTRVPVDMTITSPTDGAAIYYSTDGSEPNEQSIRYQGPVQIDSPTEIRARAFKDGLYRSQESRAKFRAQYAQKALFVVGGPIGNGNNLWPSTLRAAEHGYRALLYQGFEKDEIQLLAPSLELDFDGNDDFDDVDGIASSTEIEQSLVGWAKDASELVVYIVGHGGENKFQITKDGELLNAIDLAVWLDRFQNETGRRVTLIYDACRSGSFLGTELVTPTYDRVIITSSAGDQPAWFIDQGRISFSYQFWSGVFGKANIFEAYRQSSGVMRGYQQALIDANGDGIPNEKADYLAAADLRLGRGAVSAAFEPQIIGVSLPQSIGNGSVATVSVDEVSSINELARVWAVVLPPGYDNADPDAPVLEATEVDLSPTGGTAYSVTFDAFSSEGVYQVIVYAKDDQGLISAPAFTAVSKGSAELSGDTDGDGVADGADLCPAVFDDQSDFDGDGRGDACDSDDDNDGAEDASDAFPQDAGEQLDTDGDGIGNNQDDDDDGDGVLDAEDPEPLNGNVTQAARDQDEDGIADGFDNCVAVANADQLDNEGDGVGDVCDNDDDNDGITDADDPNPFTPDGTLVKDTDEDGVPDDRDAFPEDPLESLDTDSDGVGNNQDDDDDGDGIPDSKDGFALISLDGRTDTDDDGFPDDCDAGCLETGMISDADDDNDGVADSVDDFPLDASESRDSDGDQLGDNADNCPFDANSDQANNDLDEQGDACDLDDDNDGFSDEEEAIDGTDPFSRYSCRDGCFSFDIDENKEAKALSDGLLVIRHLFGFSGSSLVSGATAAEGSRTSAEAISGYLSEADSQLDIDGDGESKALTDGLLLIRYLFGFTGDSLIAGAVGERAERSTSEEIEAYISERLPQG